MPPTDPPRVTTLQIPDAPNTPSSPPRQISPHATWLIPPAFFAAIILGFTILIRGPRQLYGYSLGALFVIGILWLFISIFFPGHVDPTCPACSAPSLARLSSDSTTGIRCTSCEFVDPDASSWMIAELEGVSLESIVMADRGRAPLSQTASAEQETTPEHGAD